MAEISKVAIAASEMSRKEKRKLLKKLKRKQIRRNVAVKEREICEAVANDEAEQERLRRLEEEEAERMERDRREFEAREREFLQRLEEKKRREEEEEEERQKRDEERDLANKGDEHESSEGDDWEYVEEGPAEIIWKGNEIIVKKTKVKVPKKVSNLLKEKQESERPISNPLAPQYEALEDYGTAQEVLKSVAQQVPNFGTEQDKAHCPFHLKTGVCRFGSRCSRVHFYPDKSCTLLIKNMYTGLGLAWEQDEGLECTDEEVERSFEEFYEDVHTEFLKFGEIENFKVCKNASSHLRGNVYVHYRLLESAVLAYQSINARYFARKQLSCEFVNLTRWKVAICGEYMKSRLKTCSRGSACNFIHCFRNPGGDYEWADWEKPAPRYWQKEMAALFGYSGGKFTDESVRYHLKRSRSRDPDSPHRKSPSNNIDYHRSRYLQGNRGESERKQSTPEYNRVKRRKTDSLDESYCSSDYQKSSRRNQNMTRESDLRLTRQSSINREHRVNAADESGKIKGGDRSLELKSRNSSKRKIDSESVHEHHHSSEKVSRFDVMKSPHVDRHHSKHHRHESEESLHKKKKSYSSDIDGLLREKDAHHSDKSLPIKEQSDLSDSSSNESKLGRDERSQNNRRNISSKSKPDYREYKRKSASLERDEGRCHNHSSNSSKAVSVLDGGRIDRDGKRRQRNRSRSKGSDYQSEFTDSEGERCKYRTDGRSHKSIKHRRQVKHEVESTGDASDDGRSLRYEKKPKKDRRTRSRSKNDFDFDVVSNVKRLNSNEIHHGSERSSDVLHNEESEGPVSTRDVKYYEMEPIAPINKTNDNPTTSQRVETDCELEQTYRMAALKKLEEKRKLKNALPVKSRKLNISAEIHVHENIAVENGEGSSREVGTSADSERRRI